MRTESEVEAYEPEARVEYLDGCPKCQGVDLDCSCWKRYNEAIQLYQACIPRDFWTYTPADVSHNREVFTEVVEPYMQRLSRALRGGYGLMLTGDNGVGKSMFMCLVLRKAIARGFSTYYTTMLSLDHDIKRGFSKPEVQERLEWYLTSDFVAIDELAKEQFKAGDSFTRTQVERILKSRFENSMPTLLATNASLEELEKIYGSTLTSILEGKYMIAAMEPGDFRQQMKARMAREMAKGGGV